VWDRLNDIWNYPLFTLSGGGTVAVSQFVLAIALTLVGIALSRIIQHVVRRRLAKSSVQPDVAQVIDRALFYGLLVVVVMTGLNLLHVPMAAFAFISGAVAIGVGFGAQNIINNFISGWILMSERPIRLGDFIEVGEWQGVVELVGNRSTRIRRTDGVHMLVPNSQLLEQTVVNWTLIDKQTRTIVRVGVAYGSPVRKVAELIQNVVDTNPAVRKDPAPTVIFEDFGDNALVFDVYFWCDASGERELRTIRSDIRFRIADVFEENDIVIAFPQRDVHFDTATPIPVRMIDDDR
jgi:small-conductance mechanosensitive channel